jgi:hypothetical protein
MRGRLILNLVLVVIIAAGGALLYFEPWAEPPAKEPRLVDIAPENVERLRTERAGKDGGTVVLERGDQGWRVTEPFAMRASETTVEGLIDSLRQRSKDQFAVGDRDLAAFGLKDPKVRVTFGDTTVAIGGEAPIERARYAKVGETIHVASTGLARAADKPATGFVPRRLLPKDARISAIEHDAFKVVRATNTDDATWSVARSEVKPAEGAAKSLASAWSGATAVDVKRRHGGDAPEPAIRVHLEGRDAPLKFIRLGTAGDTATGEANVAVTRPDLPVRYLVTGPTAERLFTLDRTSDNTGGGSDQKS